MGLDNENSCYAVFCLVFTQFTVFVPVGIALSILNPSTPALQVFINESVLVNYGRSATPEYTQLMVDISQSSINIGALTGVMCVSVTLKNLSRKENIALVHILFLASAILMSPVATLLFSIESFIGGRFLCGVARGMAFIAVPLFVAETTSRETLWFYQGLLTLVIELGVVIGAVVGHPMLLGTRATLPLLFAAPAVFSVAFLCCLPWFPETPTWLFLNRHQSKRKLWSASSEANCNLLSPSPDIAPCDDEKSSLLCQPRSLRLLRKLRCFSHEQVQAEHDGMVDEIAADHGVQRTTLRQFIRVNHYRRQLIGCTVIMTGSQASAISVLFYYSSSIFEDDGIPFELASYCTIGILSLVVIISILVMPFITRFGSKKVFVVGGVIAIIGQMTLVASAAAAKFECHKVLSMVGCVILTIGACGPKQSFAVLPSELTTCVTRPKVMWIASLGMYVGSTLITFCTPMMFGAWGQYSYLAFMIIYIPVLLYVRFCVPETHLKSVQQIQREFRRASSFID